MVTHVIDGPYFEDFVHEQSFTAPARHYHASACCLVPSADR